MLGSAWPPLTVHLYVICYQWKLLYSDCMLHSLMVSVIPSNAILWVVPMLSIANHVSLPFHRLSPASPPPLLWRLVMNLTLDTKLRAHLANFALKSVAYCLLIFHSFCPTGLFPNVTHVPTEIHPLVAGAKCVDVRGAQFTNGTAVQMYVKFFSLRQEPLTVSC
jgi:hypothetical protein